MLYINDYKLSPTIFPDKTSQVWKIPPEVFLENHLVKITWDFESEGEFMQLAQLKTLLDEMGLFSELHLSYLPYGRQDKEISNNTTFGLHTFAKLINSLKFNEVRCLDPHSIEAAWLIDRFVPHYPVELVEALIHELEVDLVCYPDKGAVTKYSSKYAWTDVIFGVKTRNQQTGVIVDYHLDADSEHIHPQGCRVLIVDDICDGGATFTLLSNMLYQQGASEVNLFVTHGIFSKGLKPLKEAGILRVFDHKGECFESQGFIVRKGF